MNQRRRRHPSGRCETMALHVQPLEPRFALAASAGTEATSVTGPAAGSYQAGDDLVFQVAFNNPVVVVGTPRLGLRIGTTLRPADYVGGSGSTSLNFRYTLQAGDTDTNGIALTRSIRLPTGSSIRDLETLAAASTESIRRTPRRCSSIRRTRRSRRSRAPRRTPTPLEAPCRSWCGSPSLCSSPPPSGRG